MPNDPGQLSAAVQRDLSTCEECGASIDPHPPDGFTRYARQVVGYLDHFAEAHPDHEILNTPEVYL